MVYLRKLEKSPEVSLTPKESFKHTRLLLPFAEFSSTRVVSPEQSHYTVDDLKRLIDVQLIGNSD